MGLGEHVDRFRFLVRDRLPRAVTADDQVAHDALPDRSKGLEVGRLGEVAHGGDPGDEEVLAPADGDEARQVGEAAGTVLRPAR